MQGLEEAVLKGEVCSCPWQNQGCGAGRCPEGGPLPRGSGVERINLGQ